MIFLVLTYFESQQSFKDHPKIISSTSSSMSSTMTQHHLCIPEGNCVPLMRMNGVNFLTQKFLYIWSWWQSHYASVKQVLLVSVFNNRLFCIVECSCVMHQENKHIKCQFVCDNFTLSGNGRAHAILMQPATHCWINTILYYNYVF